MEQQSIKIKSKHAEGKLKELIDKRNAKKQREEPVSSDIDEAAAHHKEMVEGANRPETEFANTDFIAGAMWYKYNH